jgi:transmembrane sensor
MIDISNDVLLLAFNLKKGEPLTEQQKQICEEFASGRWLDLMKISVSDQNLCRYLLLYEKLKGKDVPRELK